MHSNQKLGSLPKDRNLTGLLLNSLMRNTREVFMKKGIKKGTCLVHGELTEENTSYSKELYGIRKRCKICMRERKSARYHSDSEYRKRMIKETAEWKKNNREHIRQLTREDRKNNPEKYRKWARDHYQRIGNEEHNTRTIAYNKKIPLDKYREMYAKQDGKCAVCGFPETRKSSRSNETARLCLDHNHETGEYREFLCHSCNTMIGKAGESIDILKKAISYLRKHSK